MLLLELMGAVTPRRRSVNVQTSLRPFVIEAAGMFMRGDPTASESIVSFLSRMKMISKLDDIH
jgi:hypothetical protein